MNQKWHTLDVNELKLIVDLMYEGGELLIWDTLFQIQLEYGDYVSGPSY